MNPRGDTPRDPPKSNPAGGFQKGTKAGSDGAPVLFSVTAASPGGGR